jgi:protein-tyrosine phosphatase
MAVGKRTMIDFHSHCLPVMDDGAVDLAESVGMLCESFRQGVDTVVATPHFYRNQETVKSFLARREESFKQLESSIPQGLTVLTGAEVLLFEGLSRLDLRPLCIAGTNHILLEMPFMPPPAWLYEELENIALGQRLDVILAHVDRYMPWYSKEKIASVLDFPGLTVQLKAEAFLDAGVYRALRRWLPEPKRLVLGSDMHHLDRRPPNLAQACQKMQRKAVGRRWLSKIEQNSNSLLISSLQEFPLEGFF